MRTTERKAVRRFFKRKEVDEDLNAEISAVYAKMRHERNDPEEYAKWSQQLAQLKKLREEGYPRRVSRDTVWLVLGNLAGVIVIVAYERANVMLSRGFNHLIPPKPPK